MYYSHVSICALRTTFINPLLYQQLILTRYEPILPRTKLSDTREVPFLLKKSLGKTGGPASNQTKIQFFKKFLFIIEHIKKTRIFLKKKKEDK
jgi:hypothetical protein